MAFILRSLTSDDFSSVDPVLMVAYARSTSFFG